MTPPIIMAAFGTTSSARDVYGLVDAHIRRRFENHEIIWAFTSRIVRSRLKKNAVNFPTPSEAVARLADHGHRWAVVQSFNMICGHEFHRLVNDVRHPDLRVSVGHSLLCAPSDHEAVAAALSPVFAADESEALVLVGHGTDHCAWTVYPAFFHRLRALYGQRAFGGVIEEGGSDRDKVIDKIADAGFRKARLFPFMLVAGVHFREDLAGPEDSWKTALEDRGIEVALEIEALGAREPVMDIFSEHIESALAVIP